MTKTDFIYEGTKIFLYTVTKLTYMFKKIVNE